MLAGVGKQLVYDVLEALARRGNLGGTLCYVASALLQAGHHAVGNVHLIVQILTLQLEQLPVERRGKAQVHLCQHIYVEQRLVDRAYHVVAYPPRFGWRHLQVDTLEHVRRKLAALLQTAYHLVKDGALAHAVHAAEHVHLPVEVPYHVFHAAP